MNGMFLCAVARPRGDRNGNVGLCPVVERSTTQKTRANCPDSVEELRSVSITRGYLDSLPTPLPCDATSLANVSPAMLSIAASGILGAAKAKSSAPQVSTCSGS
ncbi:unnamed protein product [Phytophthora fragariaefolia]|uniref:Unnamed protein product n=1 Tax=Phytophthora fragariaefolia TaxID=1490495 RepID=A0A9W6Y9D5_9STRA|nr:unnamed protein product [Phytophthora fragariaefolia]